ncbi:MAG: DUF1836 domain-containing protein [Butyricicoccus sp.]
MPRLEKTIEAVFADRDIMPDEVPQLDLYMDQVLTLFDQCLSGSKRTPEDKLLTKTMVNNYVKEGLMTPVKGKKYTRQQIMQLLCVYHLKQTLAGDEGADRSGRCRLCGVLRASARGQEAHARSHSAAADRPAARDAG